MSHQNRRILHHPFFPVEPPLPSPQSQPQPKYPFPSLSPHAQTQNPFFPHYSAPPSPRPPPPPHHSAVAIFPANISSPMLPHSSTLLEKPISAKFIALIVSFSLLSATLVISVVAFLLHRHYFHHRRRFHDSKTDSLRLFPPDTIPSDSTTTTISNLKKPPSPRPHPKLTRPAASSNGSEFLYLGTLVTSRDINCGAMHAQCPGNSNAADASGSPSLHYQRLESPELHPLPPLPRNHFQNQQNFNNSNMGSDEEEEFFSPRGSTGGDKESPEDHVASFGINFSVQSFQSRSSNSSHYSNSNSPNQSSSSPSIVVDLTPMNSIISKSPVSLVNFPRPLRGISPPAPQEQKLLSPSASSTGEFENSPYRVASFSARNSETMVDCIGISGRIDGVRLPPPAPPPRLWETPVVSSGALPPLVAPSRPFVWLNVGSISGYSEAYGGRSHNNLKPMLKPLHWDKVRATRDRAMVWDQLQSSSFQLNEEMIETLLVVNSSSNNPNQGGKHSVSPLLNQEFQLLDPKKSQNIAILLRALNVTIDAVCEALLEGNADMLGTELLESLQKMAPTHEEERRLKEFKNESLLKLGLAEKFLKAVLHIPQAFSRLNAMLYMANFDSQVEYLKKSFETLEEACKELRSSRMLLKLLKAVLKTGNQMNDGTNRGDAHAFTLDTLLKLVDVKGADGRTTLLHFVVQEIIREEGSCLAGADQKLIGESSQQLGLQNDGELRKRGLQVVSSLSGELSIVKKAASMDSGSFSSDVLKLGSGITKVIEILKLNEELPLTDSSRKFSETMNTFLKKAEKEIIKIQAQESVTRSMVNELTEYFHGDSNDKEAHPFRIFMVVKDFLSILDQVCKDVGKMNDWIIISSGCQFPLPVNPSVIQAGSGVKEEKPFSDNDSGVSSP